MQTLLVFLTSFTLLLCGPVWARGEAVAEDPYLKSHAESIRKAAAKAKNYHVLVLNSYNKGYTWTDNEVKAIEESFTKDTHIILQIEYMDTKVINTPDHFDLLERLYANKYKKNRFDAIIATDDDALKFLRRYRQALFPGTPVVFAGINNFKPAKIEGFDNVTGVNEQADFKSNLDLILRLQPATKDVYVITDQLTAGRLIRKEFDATATKYRSRLKFHYLTEMSMAEVRAKVAKLPADAVVFYLTFFRDAAGKSFSPWEAIPLISRSASVPLYGQVDYMLGKGILGGRVKSSYYQGQVAAQLVRRILSGEAAADIPIVMESPNYFMFDYLQLQRFGISVDALPEGSLVLNEPQTFYYKYKTLIWTVIGVIALLVGFILLLLFNISKRKRAQKGLQDIIGAMSSVLEHGSIGEMREALVRVIHRVIFLEKQIDKVEFFNYTGKMRAFDPESLQALSPHIENDDVSKKLIKKSIEQDGCSVEKNECVALFKSKSIPGNVVYMKGERRFDDMDRDLLEILTNNVSMAMESLEKNKIQESLETARKIQLSMLPHHFEEVTDSFNVDVHARLIAAKEVGGDFYDIFAIDDDHLCMAVGDVSDKGVPAALFMAMAKTLIRSEAEHNLYPEKILRKVNNELVRDNEQCMFVTLFLAIFNRKSGQLHYANGGHNPPCLIKADGSIAWLPLAPGVALGVMEEMTYQAQSIPLATGDGLFIYTDGVTEAMNSQAELFGEERLLRWLEKKSQLNAVTVSDELIAELGEFSVGAGQSDDITVLFIRNEEA